MKYSSLFLFLSFSLLFISCRKDVSPAAAELSCPHYEETDDSFDQLIISTSTSPELYEKTYDTEDQIGVSIDVNCDGFGDFKISAETDADWYDGFTITEAELTFQTLSPNLSVFTADNEDTTYVLNNDDTIGNTIYHNNISSNNYIPGSVVQSTFINNYIKGFEEGDSINASDNGWSTGSTRMLYKYSNSKTWWLGLDTNGYYHEAPQQTSSDKGLITSDKNYIALKYEGSNGVKLGYVKVDAWVSGSFAHLNYYFKRMHR